MQEVAVEELFAERVTFITLSLMDLKSELKKFGPRAPLTLVCDSTKITYGHNKGVLVFSVAYALRATDRRGDDAWTLSCQFDLVYRFEGAPPTQGDADAMRISVLTLAHNNLRETAHFITQLCGLPTLVIDLANFPEPK